MELAVTFRQCSLTGTPNIILSMVCCVAVRFSICNGVNTLPATHKIDS